MYQWIQSAAGQVVSVKSFLSLTSFPKWAYNLIKKKESGEDSCFLIIIASFCGGDDVIATTEKPGIRDEVTLNDVCPQYAEIISQNLLS